jgi:hypothetical protein
MNKVYTAGDTIRITNTITGYEGQLIDPDSLTFNMYTIDGKSISSTPVDLVENKLSEGLYFVEIIATEGTTVFEWLATKYGKPYVKRDTLEATFLGYW